MRYRPRSQATDAAGLAAELGERRAADLDRGFTAHGPHRDELVLTLDGAPLRAYGSQGQQRAALLALLFAERELLTERRDRPPLMLLDDVMSELDSERRERWRTCCARAGSRSSPPQRQITCPGWTRTSWSGSSAGSVLARWPREALAPRPLGRALDAAIAQARPAGLLAAVQSAWPEVAGAVLAAATEPTSERDGTVTVSCRIRGLGAELELLAPDLQRRLNE